MRPTHNYVLALGLAILAGLALASAVSAQKTCRWAGTAPYCAGSCGAGETEEAQIDVAHKAVNLPSVNHFGNGCVFGSKSYCCKTPGLTCRWDGTAPFCAGSCKSDEFVKKTCSNCIGKPCWSGSKVQCCKPSSTGSSGQPLEIAPTPRFAGIWEEGDTGQRSVRHGMTSAAYQQQFEAHAAKGYRLLVVDGYRGPNGPLFAAVWGKGDVSNQPGVARHGLDSDAYQREFDRQLRRGFQLVHVSGYSDGEQDRYAAIWEQRPNGPVWAARHRMTSQDYQKAYQEMAGKGYRLVHVDGYAAGDRALFAAIWEKRGGPSLVARHDMTQAKLQSEFDHWVGQGFRLAQMSAYTDGGITRYAGYWEKVGGPGWEARSGYDSKAFESKLKGNARKGYRLRHVSGHGVP